MLLNKHDKNQTYVIISMYGMMANKTNLYQRPTDVGHHTTFNKEPHIAFYTV